MENRYTTLKYFRISCKVLVYNNNNKLNFKNSSYTIVLEYLISLKIKELGCLSKEKKYLK